MPIPFILTSTSVEVLARESGEADTSAVGAPIASSAARVSRLLKGEAVLRALLLFAVLLSSALASNNADLLPGLDPNGHQSAGPTSDQLPGLDPNGAK
jgi:hypothetical protein